MVDPLTVVMEVIMITVPALMTDLAMTVDLHHHPTQLIGMVLHPCEMVVIMMIMTVLHPWIDDPLLHPSVVTRMSVGTTPMTAVPPAQPALLPDVAPLSAGPSPP